MQPLILYNSNVVGGKYAPLLNIGDAAPFGATLALLR